VACGLIAMRSAVCTRIPLTCQKEKELAVVELLKNMKSKNY
jgi:hypothetical protein